MHAIKMHFALILMTVMAAFAKMDLMVMDSIAVFYVLIACAAVDKSLNTVAKLSLNI